jgi:hypothetical protein
MMKAIRIGVAALAFTALVAQPIAASAGDRYWCPPGNSFPSWGVAWAFGFFLCGGMTVGQQDVYAAKHHTKVTGRYRLRGFVSCILPPLGLYRLDHHRLP